MSAGVIVAIVLAGLVLIFLTILSFLTPNKAYFTALFSGCYIRVFKCVGLKMRGLEVLPLVKAYILARKSNLGLTLSDLELVLAGGGHPQKIVEGLIAGKTANIKISFDFVKAVDFAGRDPLAVVREIITPKVIELPLISSVAKDNREINAKVSLTLKVKIENFLKGVAEDTISARAVEAVVTKIANTERASDLVARPEFLDKAVFDAQVDEDSKYELCSADVIHVDLGNDRGLAIEKERIEKERILQANKLEARRLTALAEEQEMKVKAQEFRAKVVENEAEVPKAVVKAIEEGKLQNVVDYYKLQNIQADTEMRRRLVGKTTDEFED